jgi:hypothetical protein
MRKVLRSYVVAAVSFVMSGFLLATLTVALREASPAAGETKNGPIVAPQVKDKLGPGALEALQKEQSGHTNEAVIVTPFGDTMGVIATFANFTVLLTQTEEPDAASLSLFKGEQLIQKGHTTFHLDEETGTVDVTATFQNVGTGDRLVGEVSIAEDSSPNRVRALFTSVGNEADRVGPMSPIGLTHIDSHALRVLDEVPCGSGCWSSGYFPNTVECIPHQSKGCLDEGCSQTPTFSNT